jgi:ATP-binding cassette subfamily F protein uup
MDTLDMLQEILAEYQGTLIIVSHDRDFLDRTVTEVLAFEGDAQIDSYIGGYSDYLEAREDRAPKKAKPEPGKKVEKPAPPKSNLTYAEEHELKKLPEQMAKLEGEIAALHLVMGNPDLYTADPERFDKTVRQLANVQKRLDAAEARWLELEEKRNA